MDEGSYYHIYNRGNNQENIFYEKKNYLYFLQKFDFYLSDFVDVFAYCLMPNHFHFLIRVKETSKVLKTFEVLNLTPLEKAFKDFFICYSKSINRSYGRTGSLFQYKFKRKEIKTEDYLIRLIQYIHSNPINAGLCKNYTNWEFSSYNAILSDLPSKLKKDEVIDLFDDKKNFIDYHKINIHKDDCDFDF